MRFLSVLLSFCITFNVLASSGTLQELERHIDEYQYVLTVEWDQKDQKYYDAQTDEFVSKLNELILKNNISREEILSLSEKKIKDKNAFEAMKLKMSLLDRNISPDALAQTLRESAKDFYSKGASWNGDVAVIVPVALMAILIGFAVWHSLTYECVAWEERYNCTTDEYCANYSYDFDGNSYCSYYQEETYCGWDDVCTKYEKKKK